MPLFFDPKIMIGLKNRGQTFGGAVETAKGADRLQRPAPGVKLSGPSKPKNRNTYVSSGRIVNQFSTGKSLNGKATSGILGVR
jgi:hypothetical protein